MISLATQIPQPLKPSPISEIFWLCSGKERWKELLALGAGAAAWLTTERAATIRDGPPGYRDWGGRWRTSPDGSWTTPGRRGSPSSDWPSSLASHSSSPDSGEGAPLTPTQGFLTCLGVHLSLPLPWTKTARTTDSSGCV